MRETKTVAIWGWEQKIENERTWSKALFSCMSITACLISFREPASTPRAAAKMMPRKYREISWWLRVERSQVVQDGLLDLIKSADLMLYILQKLGTLNCNVQGVTQACTHWVSYNIRINRSTFVRAWNKAALDIPKVCLVTQLELILS
jgi:hypothetical protein